MKLTTPLLFCWITTLIASVNSLNADYEDYRYIERDGDLNIAFFTFLRYGQRCERPTLYYIWANVEFDHAFQVINARNDILPNISLGQIIINDCGDPLMSIRKAAQLLPNAKYEEVSLPSGVIMHRKPFEAVGIFGASISDVCVAMTPFANAFEIPVVSNKATSDDLNDRARFPYFLSLVPPEKISMQVAVHLALHFNWSYVTILYSDGAYGSNAYKQMRDALRGTAICIAFTWQMSALAPKEEYRWLAKKLKTEYYNAKVVYIFSAVQQQKLLYDAMDSHDMHNMFLLITLDVYNRARPQENAIAIEHHAGKCPGIVPIIQKANPWKYPDDPWMSSAWEMYHKCSWSVNKSSDKSCYKYPEMPQQIMDSQPGYAAIQNGVHLYALALHRLITDKCPEQFYNKTVELLRKCITGSELYNYMRHESFQGCDGPVQIEEEGRVLGSFDILTFKLQDNGKYAWTKFGEWDEFTESISINTSILDWTMFLLDDDHGNETTIPESVCSKPCPEKHFYIHKDVKCCWDCRSCRDNEIIVNASHCEACPSFTWPDHQTATLCERIDPHHPKLTDQQVLALFSSAVVGLVVTTAVTIAFRVHHDHPLIKATSRGLCYLILAGSYITSTTVLLYATKPTKAVCLLRDVGFHVGVHLLFGPLLIRTIRIFRIFSSGKRSVRRPKFVSSSSQMVLALILTTTQALLITGVHVVRPTSVELQQLIPTVPAVELVCVNPGFLIPLACNLVVILVCGVFGFLSRKLPENYSESWFIFVSVSSTIFMWLIFLPTSYAAIHAHQRSLVLSLCLVLNVYITLGLLFVPKIYAIVFVGENKMKIAKLGTKTSTQVTTETVS